MAGVTVILYGIAAIAGQSRSRSVDAPNHTVVVRAFGRIWLDWPACSTDIVLTLCAHSATFSKSTAHTTNILAGLPLSYMAVRADRYLFGCFRAFRTKRIVTLDTLPSGVNGITLDTPPASSPPNRSMPVKASFGDSRFLALGTYRELTFGTFPTTTLFAA